MMKAFLLAVLLGLVGTSFAADSCLGEFTYRARQDPYSSWTDYAGTTRFQIYDIVVTNKGTCPLTSIVGFFSGGAGFVSEGWNYNITTGALFNFGAFLPVGESFYGAGFVLANSSQPTLAITRFQCSADCSAPTSAPSTTQAPSTQSPSTTQAPTQTPSTQAPSTQTPSTSAPNTCAVTASLAKDDYSWTDGQGRTNSVYRLTITNAGPCALKDYALSFAWGSSAELISIWNLESTRGGYLVKGYGETLAAGASYSAAGFILANQPAGSIPITVYGSNCACN